MNSTGRSSRFSRAFPVLATILLLLLGCDSSSNPAIAPGPSASDREAWRYFPLNVGDEYLYASDNGSSMLYTTEDVFNTEGGIQGRFSVDRGSITDEYAFWIGKELRRSLYDDIETATLDLKPPYEVGNSWRRFTDVSDSYTFFSDATIIDTNFTVTVPAGTFQTLVVQSITVSENPPAPRTVDTLYTYFARDVGMVKWNTGNLIVALQSYNPAPVGE